MDRESRSYIKFGGAAGWGAIGTLVGTIAGAVAGSRLGKGLPPTESTSMPGTYFKTSRLAGTGGAILGATIGGVVATIVGYIRGKSVADQEEMRTEALEARVEELQARVSAATEYLNHPAEAAKSQVAGLNLRREQEAASGAVKSH